MASAISTSKEDPTVQLWDFVQENLLQFHCEECFMGTSFRQDSHQGSC